MTIKHMTIQQMIEHLRELESFEQKREQIREYAREIRYHAQEIIDLVQDMMKWLDTEDSEDSSD